MKIKIKKSDYVLIDKEIQLKFVTDWWLDNANDDDQVNLDLSQRNKDKIVELRDWLLKRAKSPELKRLSNSVKGYVEILNSPSTAVIKNYVDFNNAIVAYLKEPSNKGLVFYEDKNGCNPYMIKTAKRERGGDGEPSYYWIKLVAALPSGLSLRTTVDWYLEDLSGGETFDKTLSRKGVMLFNKTLYEEYKKDLDVCSDVGRKIGAQMRVKNLWIRMNKSHWTDSESLGMSVVVRDKNTLVVVDRPSRNSEVSSEKIEINGVVASGFPPIHPLVYCYNLKQYENCYVHISNLEEYVYNTGIRENLVLDKTLMDFMDIMIGVNVEHDDIISKKSGGTIILATGAAGLGKTLTAEIYAEAMKKPLYVVQSAQLGVKLDELEKNLEQILNRAEAWGAVLMIDEADTYIIKRGENIVQNAIVGVFLRLLEYYNGVLFMTSNRPEIVDDAIMSRVSIHVPYETPNESARGRIWAIHLSLYRIEATDSAIDKLAKTVMSGRDIRNACNLMSKVIKAAGVDVLDAFNKVKPYMVFSIK